MQNKEALLFLAVTKEAVSGDYQEKIERIVSQNHLNWDEFKTLIASHDLASLLYPAIKDIAPLFPAVLIEFLQNNYYCSLAYCQNIWQEFLRIAKAYREANVSLVPLKGVALLEDIYSHHPVRPMTDIDLLVKEEDFSKAALILSDLGYRKDLYGLKEEYWKKNQYHIAFAASKEKNLPRVELHWSLDYKRKGKNLFPELWQRTRQIQIHGQSIELLSPEDNFLSLALHNRRFGNALSLKNVYDSALILKKYAASFDWEYVFRQCSKYRLDSCVYFILAQAEFAFGMSLPDELQEELNLPSWKKALIRRFIEKNTFSLKADNLYLKSHFLLYNNFWEPIWYIINIPQEQFAKFYQLEAYSKKTKQRYVWRFFYIPFKTIAGICTGKKRW